MVNRLCSKHFELDWQNLRTVLKYINFVTVTSLVECECSSSYINLTGVLFFSGCGTDSVSVCVTQLSNVSVDTLLWLPKQLIETFLLPLRLCRTLKHTTHPTGKHWRSWQYPYWWLSLSPSLSLDVWFGIGCGGGHGWFWLLFRPIRDDLAAGSSVFHCSGLDIPLFRWWRQVIWKQLCVCVHMCLWQSMKSN